MGQEWHRVRPDAPRAPSAHPMATMSVVPGATGTTLPSAGEAAHPRTVTPAVATATAPPSSARAWAERPTAHALDQDVPPPLSQVDHSSWALPGISGAFGRSRSEFGNPRYAQTAALSPVASARRATAPKVRPGFARSPFGLVDGISGIDQIRTPVSTDSTPAATPLTVPHADRRRRPLRTTHDRTGQGPYSPPLRSGLSCV